MQPASHAHSIQAISHASTSNAWQSDVNRQSSSGCGCVAEEEAHAAAVGSDADVSDGSPVLREEGEGRGPRKEFFAAVGAGISAGVCVAVRLSVSGACCVNVTSAYTSCQSQNYIYALYYTLNSCA